MDWTTIIAAIITAISAGYGVYKANLKSSALIEYRLSELEKKVDKHNHFSDRITSLEQFEALQLEKNKEFERSQP